MRKQFSSSVIVTLLVITLSFISPSTLQVVSAQTGGTVTVLAIQPWTDTSLDVEAGSTITITASGIIKIASSDPGKSPSANDTPCIAAEGWLTPGLPCWSLVGRIGGNGEPFAVGVATTLTATISGRLYLGVNDELHSFSDNTGAWIANISVELLPFNTTLFAPYEYCEGNASHSPSPPPRSAQIIAQGFSFANADCSAITGAINNNVLAFGGRRGNVFESPSHEANSESFIGASFTPRFTGTLLVEAHLLVNAKAGSASGSDTAIPTVQSIAQDFFLKTLAPFVQIAQAIILETGGGVRTDAFLVVDTSVARHEATTLVGGRGFSSSFPYPDWSQGETFNAEQTIVSLSIPVVEGQTILIRAGMRTHAEVHGWSLSHWLRSNNQDSFVSSIVLTEER